MTLKHALFLMLFVAVATLMTSCKYDKEDELYPSQTCDTTGLTYTADMKAFFDTKCVRSGCHAAGNFDPNLSVFLTDSVYISLLYPSATNASHSGRFSWDDCDKARLRSWCANPLE